MFKLNAVRLTLIYVLFVSILLGLEIAKNDQNGVKVDLNTKVANLDLHNFNRNFR